MDLIKGKNMPVINIPEGETRVHRVEDERSLNAAVVSKEIRKRWKELAEEERVGAASRGQTRHGKTN